jgi:hypothetical protein
LVKQSLQERTTPPTARSRSTTVTQLAHAARLFDSQVIEHLALRDVKTEAKFVVQLHAADFLKMSRSFEDAWQLAGG